MNPAGYADVAITGGPLLEQFREQHATLPAMDEDALQGPLALFAVGDRFLPFTRSSLLGAKQTAAQSSEWKAGTVDGTQSFRPFYAIGLEATRLYQPISA